IIVIVLAEGGGLEHVLVLGLNLVEVLVVFIGLLELVLVDGLDLGELWGRGERKSERGEEEGRKKSERKIHLDVLAIAIPALGETDIVTLMGDRQEEAVSDRMSEMRERRAHVVVVLLENDGFQRVLVLGFNLVEVGVVLGSIVDL
ncbi:hypothetical protein BCR35DRAFT_304916, partial [Leucosporidium creatinivorum]